MTPCESCPTRFESTRRRATIVASLRVATAAAHDGARLTSSTAAFALPVTSPARSVNLRLGGGRGAFEKIEIAALVGLGDVLLVERAIATLETRRGIFHAARRRASSASRDLQLELARRRRRARSDRRRCTSAKRAAGERFRRDVQHACAVAGAAHARVRDAHHVADACARVFSESATAPTPACRARRAGPAFCSTSTESASTSSAGIVDARRHVVVVGEHHRACRCASSRRVSAAAGLITAPSGARLPRSTARLPRRHQRACRACRITSSIEDLRRRRCSRRACCPLTVRASRSSRSPRSLQQRAQAAGVVEILHQVLARRAGCWRAAACVRDERVEAVERRAACRRAAPSRSGARPRWSSRRARARVVIALSNDAAR